MKIPNNITTNHVFYDLEEMDKIGVNPRRQSTKFDLYHRNKTFWGWVNAGFECVNDVV